MSGGLEFRPQSQLSLPRNLEIEYISYLHVTECKYVSSKCCPRLRQKQSERYINSKFSWGGGACPQTPLVGMHAFRTLLSSCHHPGFLPSPPQLKILYETLLWVESGCLQLTESLWYISVSLQRTCQQAAFVNTMEKLVNADGEYSKKWMKASIVWYPPWQATLCIFFKRTTCTSHQR